MNISLKIKNNVALFAFILLMMTKCSYLLPDYIGITLLTPEFIACVLSLGWCFVELRYIKMHNYKYMWIIIYGIGLVLLSSYQASSLYSGQSIIDGILCQKFALAALSLYFPVANQIKRGKMTIDEVVHVICALAVFQIMVYTIQYIIGPNHVFLNCYYTTPRMDASVSRIRLYGTASNITFMIMYAATKVTSEKKKMKPLIMYLLGMYYMIVINQSRSAIVVCSIALIVALIFARGKSVKKASLIIVAVLLVAVFINSNFFQDLLETISNTTVNSHNTFAVRLRSQELYLGMLHEHPLLGGGYPDSSVSSAYILSGASQGIFAVDNGVYGFAFRYGIVGLIWLFLFFIISIKNGIYSIYNSRDCMPFMVLIPIIVGYMTSASWYDGFGFFYCIIYLLYYEYKDYNVIRD